LFYTKKVIWSYEQEVRMIRELKNADKTVSVGNQIIFLFEVPKEAISEVILGYNCSDYHIELIKQSIYKDPDYSKVILKRVVFDSDGNMIFMDETR